MEIYHDDGTVPLPEEVTSEPSRMDVTSYVPRGQQWLSDNTPVEASSHYTEYTDDQHDWQKEWLTDAHPYAGWATAPEEEGPDGGAYDETYPAWAMTDLGEICRIKRVVLFPCAAPYGDNFPQDFRIQVSDDGETWNTVKEVTGAASPAEDPYVIDLDRYAVGRYVRIYVTRRASNAEVTGINGPMVQLAEMGVYGLYGAPDPADKSALEAAVAEASQKSLEGYTEASVSAFRAALEQAQRILAEPYAAQEDVEAALSALLAADKA